ncbi:MAG: MFS transporter, partial [Dehalococcoidia bacterium]
MKRPPHPRKLFYGWWIVGAGMGIQLLVGALLFQAFGAYAAVLRDEFGWSKTIFSAAFSMGRVESGFLGPLQGWLIDRFGPRAVMRVGLVLFAVGFMLFSQINSPLTFFLTFFLIAVGSSLGGFMALTVSIVNWFERRRAMALGIMSSGLAVGGLLLPLIILSFGTWGWRNTAFASGVIILVVGLPLTTFVRHRPEQYGDKIDGINAPRPRRAATPTQDRDFTAREALRTPAFWYISLGHAAALLVVSALMVHLVLHVNEKLGYSLATAGAVVALMTAFQIVGQIGGGFIGDRVDKRGILVACMLGHATALLLLAYATAFWMVALFAIIHGLSWGARGPLQQALRADYFGRASFGAIMGFS